MCASMSFVAFIQIFICLHVGVLQQICMRLKCHLLSHAAISASKSQPVDCGWCPKCTAFRTSQGCCGGLPSLKDTMLTTGTKLKQNLVIEGGDMSFVLQGERSNGVCTGRAQSSEGLLSLLRYWM